MSRKFSEIIEEQVKKTNAILKYVEKKSIKSPVVYMQLLIALNSLKVVQMITESNENGKPFVEIDQQAAFVQMKNFFNDIDDILKKR